MSPFVQLWFAPVVIGLMVSKVVIHVVSFRRLSPILGVRTGVEPWTPVISAHQLRRARQISRVVNLAAHYAISEINCFPKALMARVLFGIYRVPYCLFFGLGREARDAEFDAHAWMVSGDSALGQRRSFERYTVVSVFVSPALGRRVLKQNSEPCRSAEAWYAKSRA